MFLTILGSPGQYLEGRRGKERIPVAGGSSEEREQGWQGKPTKPLDHSSSLFPEPVEAAGREPAVEARSRGW